MNTLALLLLLLLLLLLVVVPVLLARSHGAAMGDGSEPRCCGCGWCAVEASSLGGGGNGSMLEMSLARGNWVI